MLAARIDYSKQALSRVELGQSRPSLTLIERLAAALGVPAARFWA